MANTVEIVLKGTDQSGAAFKSATGNMKAMFKGILAVGADTYNYGAKTVGSVLIDKMKVAGS